ncbi:MAG: GIY-YIG nuclease family protein [bacterium]|nr:GIY-YIG nuclease family protein [bacterium]
MNMALHKTLPNLPGVYLFKNAQGGVIYIGKAKSLKKRVQTYFQKHDDWKIKSLIDEHHDVDYILTHNELEAAILEAELIKEHQPKFNVLLRDGQPFLYILFTHEPLPKIQVVRNKKEKGKYFGPFLHKQQARNAYHFLVRTFRLSLCNKQLEHGCLDYHIGTCPGSCKPDFKPEDYLFRLQLAQDVLKGKDKEFVVRIKEKIKEYNHALSFEKAKHLSEYLDNFEDIFKTIALHFSTKKFETDIFVATTPRLDIATIHQNSAHKLQHFLKLDAPASTIDCFDISHFQSRYLVGSCVRFTNGIPEKNKFRRFKIKTLDQQNDYAALQEIVTRRYKDMQDIPDLLVIDGGKGQLNAIKKIMPNASCVSLAKREERLYGDAYPEGITLDISTNVGKLFIAIRDYAHHFAISYHRLRREKEFKTTLRKIPLLIDHQ